MKTKMNTKSFLVSLIAAMSMLLLAAAVSAFSGDLVSTGLVKVDGMDASFGDVSVIAGEKIQVEVYFTSLEDTSDVKVKAEIEGDNVDINDRTSLFDVENGKQYKKTLSLQVPYDLKEELSDEITLAVTISNGDYKSEQDFNLRVQRPSYNLAIKSVTAKQTVEAGETFPVEVVLKNIGYNDLDDVYIALSIPALGIQTGKKYLGDLVALEECDCQNDAICEARCNSCFNDEDTDTTTARLSLDIPYDAQGGIYTLEVVVEGSEEKTETAKQIIIKNDISETVIQSGNNLVLVNPTSKIKVYKIIPEYPATVSESVVAVPADSSKTVVVTSSSNKEYKVSVFSGETLVQTVTFNPAIVEQGETKQTSPLVALTIILAVIFVILLVVLIVLITKKPEKSEEFGESYY